MKPGDTFIEKIARSTGDPHLWVMASDPLPDPDRVLLVNLTKAINHHDHSCVLKVGDHPFITLDSAINYSQCWILPETTIVDLLKRGTIEQRQTMSQDV